VLAGLALPIACFDKKSGVADKVQTVRGFCDEWGARACNDKVVDLCSAASQNDCIESQQSFCETLIPEDKYSSKTALDCLAAVQDAYSDGVLTATERDTVRDLGNACDKIVSGPGTAGKNCTVDSDCNRDEGLSCIKKTSPTGKCQIATDPPVAGGHACDADEAVCEDGFYCDGEHCLAEGEQGDDCSATVPCDSDSHCLDTDGHAVTLENSADGGSAASGGTCAARKTTGSACASDDDCVSHICTPKAGSTTGVCSSQITLAPSEQVCTTLQ
jgi:hypothetical protein